METWVAFFYFETGEGKDDSWNSQGQTRSKLPNTGSASRTFLWINAISTIVRSLYQF